MAAATGGRGQRERLRTRLGEGSSGGSGAVGAAEGSQAVNGRRTNSEVDTQEGSSWSERWDGARGGRRGIWGERGSVPRVTGLRVLEEPASSKGGRHGGGLDVLVGGSGQGLFTWETKETAEHLPWGPPSPACKLQTAPLHSRPRRAARRASQDRPQSPVDPGAHLSRCSPGPRRSAGGARERRERADSSAPPAASTGLPLRCPFPCE